MQQDDLKLKLPVDHIPSIGKLVMSNLTWWPERGIGFYPVTAGAAPYDSAYFARYQQQADTLIGRMLMRERVAFVNRHYRGPMIDVGIGSGAFLELRNQDLYTGKTSGFDVNPVAVDWLRKRNCYWDVNTTIPLPAASFFDVLEHILDFKKIIDTVQTWAFISIPIFRDGEHVVRSKHYRKDEHVWYFTEAGLVETFDQLGFKLIELNRNEETIGREDIGSFAFRRKE